MLFIFTGLANEQTGSAADRSRSNRQVKETHGKPPKSGVTACPQTDDLASRAIFVRNVNPPVGELVDGLRAHVRANVDQRRTGRLKVSAWYEVFDKRVMEILLLCRGKPCQRCIAVG
jgi:hypothetical protein